MNGDLPWLLDTIRQFGDVYDPSVVDSEARRHLDEAAFVEGATCVVDIGGGYSPLALLLARRGARVTIVDEYTHPYFRDHGDHRQFFEEAGVRLVQHDAVGGGKLPFEEDEFDAVVSFDSLEHWHHSPRNLFAELRRVLAPGARVALGAPNAVNLKKRAEVLLGRSNWSTFSDWYDSPIFYGHVREPTVADFRRVAAELDLESWQVVGRNWLGFRHGGLERFAAGALDSLLRLRPSLCSTLVLTGRMRA